MIVGDAFGIELHMLKIQRLMVLAPAHVTNVIMEIISLKFATITWFPSSIAHES
jgi:hypothetical protein